MKNRGQTLIIINILTSVLLIYSLALVNLAVSARNIEKNEDLELIAKNIAEAGIEKAVWCLNQTSGENCGGTYGSSYIGESDVLFEEGIFDVNISTIDFNTKIVEATGYYPNKSKILSKSVIKTKISTDAEKISFTYGAQMGEGGLEMGENAAINGSVYSMGEITGANGARVVGDAYVAGGTALTADQEHSVYNDDFAFAETEPQVDLAQSFIPSASNVLNKISFYIKKIGSPSNISVRIVNDAGGTPGGTTLATSVLNSSLVTSSYSWIEVAFSTPPALTSGIKYWVILDAVAKSNKYWVIGADAFDGYANGTMLYSPDYSGGTWYSSGYDINFKTWMGGIETGISGVEIDYNAYAHYLNNVTVAGNSEAYNIANSTITGNALAYSIVNSAIDGSASTTIIEDSEVGNHLWCDTFSNVTVGGETYCPTAISPPSDPGPVNLPISDAVIQLWKTAAENGGIIEGDYNISEDSSLGPVKINGNLVIDNNAILTMTGIIYVTGTITLHNGVSIILSPIFGSSSSIIMSDERLYINNNVVLSGAGTGSNIMLLTTYADTLTPAIDINNNSTNAILYAPYGIIQVTNNATLKQANAKLLRLSNNVVLYYETGLSEVSFSTGPTGGWSKLPGTWQIIE